MTKLTPLEFDALADHVRKLGRRGIAAKGDGDGNLVLDEIQWAKKGHGELPSPEDIEAAVAAYVPPPRPVFISYAALRARMTEAEREAILTLRRTVWQIDDFVTWAAAAGVAIDLNSAGVAAAKAALIAARIFSAERVAEVFAPPGAS